MVRSRILLPSSFRELSKRWHAASSLATGWLTDFCIRAANRQGCAYVGNRAGIYDCRLPPEVCFRLSSKTALDQN
jgi:hypothetical protein